MYWTCVHLYKWRRSCSSCRRTFGQHSIARMQIKSTRTNHTDQQWQYGTMAVHAGLDKSRHGECTVPIYNSAPSSSRPLPRPRMHSRQFQMSSGGSTAGLVTCLRQTISSSQNITSFTTTQRMGIETRFCDTYELPKVRSLVDQRTKFIFAEIIGNPKYSIADLEPLAAIAHGRQATGIASRSSGTSTKSWRTAPTCRCSSGISCATREPA